MRKQYITIEGIPSVLWGEDSQEIFIAIHGNMSYKEDQVIAIFAEEAVRKGYQVLSFDLPEHGERLEKVGACGVEQAIYDLKEIIAYVKTVATTISIFACSMGAYFSLQSYGKEDLEQCLFLSPVVNMRAVIEKMMGWFEITGELLQEKQEIITPMGQKLYWKYYAYVKEHPITRWPIPTSILYGDKDDLCDQEVILEFCKEFKAVIQIEEDSEHYFSTPKQLDAFRTWIKEGL